MLNHAAVWVCDLDAVCAFHEKYFSARRSPLYSNPAKGFQSHFLLFPGGGRLEVMKLESYPVERSEVPAPGYAHISLSLGSREAVDNLASVMRSDGIVIVDGPRLTGDGYYECSVLDPESNRVEITV